MKPYGIPRTKDLLEKDMACVYTYGINGAGYAAQGQGGDRRSSFRSSAAKARIRRHWKRLARIEGKNLCRKGRNYND